MSVMGVANFAGGCEQKQESFRDHITHERGKQAACPTEDMGFGVANELQNRILKLQFRIEVLEDTVDQIAALLGI